jgi:hypothetical protein
LHDGSSGEQLIYLVNKWFKGVNEPIAYYFNKPITDATNTSPIKITSPNHGLDSGTRVTISDVQGNKNANGTWTITVVDKNSFLLNGSTGNGAYKSGGSWTIPGSPTYAGKVAYGVAKGDLFLSVVPRPFYTDVQQGALNDCPLMACLAEAAEQDRPYMPLIKGDYFGKNGMFRKVGTNVVKARP